MRRFTDITNHTDPLQALDELERELMRRLEEAIPCAFCCANYGEHCRTTNSRTTPRRAETHVPRWKRARRLLGSAVADVMDRDEGVADVRPIR